MSSLSVSQILSDRGFIKSPFYPTNPPLMGDSEYKEFITEIYNVYLERQANSEYFFENEVESRHVFSFVDTLNDLANFCCINKRWNMNVNDSKYDKWNSLIKASDLPFMSALANEIQKKHPEKSIVWKFKFLSKELGGVLENQTIDLKNLKNCENELNRATKAMWAQLRSQLEELGVQALPKENAPVERIRAFLNRCDRLNEITELYVCQQKLRLPPPELKLLKKLKVLNLMENHLTSFKVPSSCAELEVIDLSYNHFTTFEISSGCVGLVQLFLSSNQLTSIKIPTTGLPKLKVLDLECNRFTSIEIPNGCGELEALNLAHNQLTSVNISIDCQRLEKVDLDHNQMTSFEVSGGYPALNKLSISYNQLTSFSIAPGYRTLKELSLGYNQLTAVKGLNGCVGLEHLYLVRNRLTSFELPSGCRELKALLLRYNQLSSFEISSECSKLKDLDLAYNQLTSFKILSECPRLEELCLDFNQLASFELGVNCEGLNRLSLGINMLDYFDIDNPNKERCLGNDSCPNMRSNILMFISDSIIERYPENPSIIVFNQQKAYPCQTPLAQFYQAIMKNKSHTELKEIFVSLHPNYRKLILEIIEGKTCFSTQSQPALSFNDIQPLSAIETQQAFAVNLHDFYRALQQCILKKFYRLSTEQRNTVYQKVYELAGSPETIDQWGEREALNNIPRLADALAAFDE